MASSSAIIHAEPYRRRVDEFLEKGTLPPFSFELAYIGKSDGLFFVRLMSELETLEIKHDPPAVLFGAKDKTELGMLSGLEIFCEPRVSAVSFEFRNEAGQWTFMVFGTTRLVRVLEVGKKDVRLEIEFILDPTHSVSTYGGLHRDDERLMGLEGPPPKSAGSVLILPATCPLADFQKEHQKYWKSLTAPKKFPTKLLALERLDQLTLGGSSSSYEIGFAPYQLDDRTQRPYLILEDGPSLPDVPVSDLEGLSLQLEEPLHGRMYDLYPEGRPFASLVSMRFGKIRKNEIECLLELKIELAEIAHHNPSHRYRDATVKLKTKLSLQDGFA